MGDIEGIETRAGKLRKVRWSRSSRKRKWRQDYTCKHFIVETPVSFWRGSPRSLWEPSGHEQKREGRKVG